MKLPSISYLSKSAISSFKRFPSTIIVALLMSSLLIFFVENEKYIHDKFQFVNWILCASIAIPLFFCVTIIAQKRSSKIGENILFHILAIAWIVFLYFTFPNSDSTHNISLPYIRYALYNISCHLLVAVIPFVFNKQLNAFWNYNKFLFLRICLAVLYSSFIVWGLDLALIAITSLFDVTINPHLYLEIAIFVYCLFNTWFFVSGIPLDFEYLEAMEEYPKGLKTFAQFVLLPLLGLYLIILYSYATKILISWNWPKGIVSYLIIFISVLGIFTFLLLHPYGKKIENDWIRKATKCYYLLLFPLIAVLFIAIFMRLNEYGFTINRYMVLLLGVWLTIVCLYTTLGKTNIKFIPISLALMLIGISFGPWGMFAVSEKSQVGRLKNILLQSKILVNDKIVDETFWIKDSLNTSNIELKNADKLSDSLRNEVYSILNYLDDHHGFSSIRSWFSQDLNALVDRNIQNAKLVSSYSSNNINEPEIYMKSMGLDYTYDNNINDPDETLSINYTADYDNRRTLIKGYDYLYSISEYNMSSEFENTTKIEIDSITYQLKASNRPALKLVLWSERKHIDFNLEDLINGFQKEYGNDSKNDITIHKMQLFTSDERYEFKFEIHNINVDIMKNDMGKFEKSLNSITGNLLVRQK